MLYSLLFYFLMLIKIKLIMDIESGEESGEYLQSSQSINKLQNLKSLITEILFNNTAYDCMPINSSMSSIDKSVSLIDAINIFVSEDIEELLVWDEGESKWIWMLTTVDIIRLIMHSLKCIARKEPVLFTNFVAKRDEEIGVIQKGQLDTVMTQIGKKTLGEIINELSYQAHGGKSYIRLKSVVKQAKLSYIVLTMILEKIHRILIEDVDSRMMISIINFKDILLYLLRIANESSTEVCSNVPIKSLIEDNCLKERVAYRHEKLAVAFKYLTETHRSLWINILDHNNRFCGMLFREDFRDILKQWNLQQIQMSVGDYLDLKNQKDRSKIPQFRFFDLEDTTKEIIWKIVMSRRNAIVCVDKNSGQVVATIGLMELFSLYVQGS